MSHNLQETREVKTEVQIACPVERVWRAISTSEELVRWFPLRAEITPGVGGSIFISWGADCEGAAPITAWDPPHRLQWTEMLSIGESAGIPVTVEFTLEAAEGGTLVRVEQAGILNNPAWDSYVSSILHGWRFELNSLKHYVEVHDGQDRTVVWGRYPVAGHAEELADQLVGPDSLTLKGDAWSLSPGDSFELVSDAIPESKWTGTVLVADWPRSFVGKLDQFNDALLRIELEGHHNEWEAWVWLAWWGKVDQNARQLEEALNASLQQAFPALDEASTH